jgi:hypothetical protein
MQHIRGATICANGSTKKISIWETELPDGTSVRLDELSVAESYAGLLEGIPTERLNARILRDAITSAERRWPGVPVHLVPPTLVSKETPTGYEGRGPTYSELPPFACIGCFMSSRSRNPDMHGTVLIVVWFQSESVVGGITLDPVSLDWWNKAMDFEY